MKMLQPVLFNPSCLNWEILQWPNCQSNASLTSHTTTHDLRLTYSSSAWTQAIIGNCEGREWVYFSRYLNAVLHCDTYLSACSVSDSITEWKHLLYRWWFSSRALKDLPIWSYGPLDPGLRHHTQVYHHASQCSIWQIVDDRNAVRLEINTASNTFPFFLFNMKTWCLLGRKLVHIYLCSGHCERWEAAWKQVQRTADWLEWGRPCPARLLHFMYLLSNQVCTSDN